MSMYLFEIQSEISIECHVAYVTTETVSILGSSNCKQAVYVIIEHRSTRVTVYVAK